MCGLSLFLSLYFLRRISDIYILHVITYGFSSIYVSWYIKALKFTFQKNMPPLQHGVFWLLCHNQSIAVFIIIHFRYNSFLTLFLYIIVTDIPYICVVHDLSWWNFCYRIEFLLVCRSVSFLAMLIHYKWHSSCYCLLRPKGSLFSTALLPKILMNIYGFGLVYHINFDLFV